MMNQTTEQQTRPFTWMVISSIAIGAIALSPLGCGKKESSSTGFGGAADSSNDAQNNAPVETEQPEQVEETEAAPIEEPSSRMNTGEALIGLALDDSVEFPLINSPSSKDIAESVAALAGAIAQGDARALHPMLDTPSQAILDQLVESDAWQDATDSITMVRICTLEEEGQTVRVGLGVESQDGAYLLGWEGELLGSSWLFAGIALETPSQANTAAQLDGSSLIARAVPEPGEIIDDTFDPTINDPRRNDKNRRRGRSGGGGGGGHRGF